MPWGSGSRLVASARRAHPGAVHASVARLPRSQALHHRAGERARGAVVVPYQSMDAFVQLLREASVDPAVVSIKITLYRLASQSHLAEALINAAENGKEVTALFELRARFDESNNIEWSQRFEAAGCHVIYGFRNFKVHSKICTITRQTENGPAAHQPSWYGQRTARRRRNSTPTSRSSPAIPKSVTTLPSFFRNIGAGEHLRQLRHPVGRAAYDQAEHPAQHRRADRARAPRREVRAVLQDELHHR